MLEANTALMLGLMEIAEQTSTLPSLLDSLKHLDNFFGREDIRVVLQPT